MEKKKMEKEKLKDKLDARAAYIEKTKNILLFQNTVAATEPKKKGKVRSLSLITYITIFSIRNYIYISHFLPLSLWTIFSLYLLISFFSTRRRKFEMTEKLERRMKPMKMTTLNQEHLRRKLTKKENR